MLCPPPPKKVMDLFLRPSYNELLPQHASLSMPVFHTNADLLTYTQPFVISHLKIKRLAVLSYFFRGDVEDLSILHDILLGNFPRFSAHRSLKISEQYFAIFFKGYTSQTKLNSDAINYVACESLGQAQFYCDHVREKL